jgi:hypothetical protein
MTFPAKICVICHQEFELRPDKPGFANRCPSCSEPESTVPASQGHKDAIDKKIESEVNALRRRAIRDMLYRQDS